MIYRVCEYDQVMGLGTCLFCASCKSDASFVQSASCRTCHLSEPRKSALRTVREKPTFAPHSPRERRLQPVFCTALRAEAGTLYFLPFAVLGVTGFRGVSFLRTIVMSAVVVSSLCPGFLFFRSRRFGTSVRYGRSTCGFGTSFRQNKASSRESWKLFSVSFGLALSRADMPPGGEG